jgi:hypothetical protein
MLNRINSVWKAKWSPQVMFYNYYNPLYQPWSTHVIHLVVILVYANINLVCMAESRCAYVIRGLQTSPVQDTSLRQH